MYKNALKEDLIRVVEELDGTVESTDTIVKLKTKIENSSTFESDPDFVKTLIQNCIDERVSQKRKRGETYIQFAARLTANFQYYCSLRKVNSFESLCDLIISDKLFETLNKETATHIGIREAEDWFKPIDLAKECDIYISSRSGSHKEIPITYGYTQDPFKNRSQNFKPKVKENYPQYLERENKIAIYAVIHLIAQETRMVEVKPINISLNQHSPSLSVRTAISPTLTEEFIIHPSVYSEIKKLGHAKSDVLLSESGSSLSADCGVSFPNVSVSNVIENSSYDLSHVKNFNTRNDSSSLIKDYKCNKIKSTKLKLSIVREKCSDIVLCKKANGAMKTSSVEFISRSPNPLPMKSKHHRFSSGLHGSTAADSVRSEWPLWHAAKSNAVFARRRIEMKLKLLDIRAELERERRTREVREQALPSEYHRQTYL
ncbi:uncharacterized protein TNCV_4891861 [Trichonephila clavipes]|nr:uncharacterized protein TNCV_4891861 [Trichonephila clavipes]